MRPTRLATSWTGRPTPDQPNRVRPHSSAYGHPSSGRTRHHLGRAGLTGRCQPATPPEPLQGHRTRVDSHPQHLGEVPAPCQWRLRSGMARGNRRRRWLRLRRVVLCVAAAALVAAALDLPAEHRDYVALRLLLDAVPHAPFHLPATAASRPVARTIQLGQGTAASLWLPTRGSRLPGVVIVTGAAPLGRHDPQAVQVARALTGAGRAVLVPDLALRTSTLSAADLERIGSAFDALATLPRVDPQRVGLLGISWGGALAVVAASTPPLAAKVAFVAPSGPSTTWPTWPGRWSPAPPSTRAAPSLGTRCPRPPRWCAQACCRCCGPHRPAPCRPRSPTPTPLSRSRRGCPSSAGRGRAADQP